MIKKLKKITAFIMLIVFSFICISCANKNVTAMSVSANYSYAEKYDKERAIIRSKEELFDFFGNNLNYPTLSDKYTSDYFLDKSLAVFFNSESSSGNKSEIKSYSISNKTITIKVKTTVIGLTCDMAYNYFIIEVDKADTKNVTTIKIIKNGKEKDTMFT